MLHSAGAKRVERRVDALVLAREVGVVTDHGRLVYLGKPRLLFTERRLRQDAFQIFRLHVRLWEGVASAAFAAFIPDQIKRHPQPPPRRRRALLWSSSP